MRTVTHYQHKKVLILGLAKSGMSAAKLLHQLGAIVTVNDGRPFEENSEAQDLLTMGMRVITGSHPVDLLDEEFELIVKNPGIPYDNPIIEKAIEKEIPIITEVELAYEISEAQIIGITGTNGKTTTTTMIGAVLNGGSTSPHAYLAGNIGEVASTVAQGLSEKDWMVTELSSFQLMGTRKFHPHIAVITNLYEAHLDYHGSREAYVHAKWEIQKNMTAGDRLVLNYHQAELRQLAEKTKATVVPFSLEAADTNGQGAYLKDDVLYFEDEKIMTAAEIGVPGLHNIENVLATIAVAKTIDVETSVIKQVLSEFGGVEHRMEYMGEFFNSKVYNDSKATNTLATIKALEGFKDLSKVVLIAGGLDRGNDFDELIPAFKSIKHAVFYGETKEKLTTSAIKAGLWTTEIVATLPEAVLAASHQLAEGDVLLFSPACASWDQFKNFEIRGRVFKETVKQIEKEWKNK